MQFGFAQARVDIEAARLMVYNAARLKDSGKSFVMEAAMAKLYASQVAEKVASKAIEWVGGVGFTKEFGTSRSVFRCMRVSHFIVVGSSS